MSQKFYEIDDVTIVKILLTNPNTNTNIDIRAQTISFSIYEDIQEPSMVLELIMVDSINLVQDFPIIGEERITIAFFTPGREEITKVIFNIFTIENTEVSSTGKASTYVIKAVTPIHLFNANGIIAKSYRDTIDNIVKDILQTCAVESNIMRLNLYAEKTKGIMPITIPQLPPFEAIDFLRQRAISSEFPSGGSFVFYENQYGYQFRSIEGLLKEGKKTISSKEFTYAPDTKTTKEKEQFAFRNIINFMHMGKFDTIDKLTKGALNNVVRSFDIITKDIDTTIFNFAEKAKFFTSTDSKSRIPNTSEFINRNSNLTKKFFVSKDSVAGQDFIDSNLGIKHSFSTFLNQNIVRILIHGDNYISVGDLIKLTLPEVSGTTEVKTNDRFNSGNYLVTKLRHIINFETNNKPKYQISLDCVRMGYK